MTTPSLLLLASLLIAASAATTANALTIGGLDIAQVNIGGVLQCSVNGNASCGELGNGAAAAGIPVQIRCGNSNSDSDWVLKTAVTDLSGKYTFALGVLDVLQFDPSKCYVAVELPVVSCAVTPPTGLLRAAINVLNVVESVLGNVLIVFVGPLSHIITQ